MFAVFVINDKNDVVFHNSDNQVLKIDYTYPDVTENRRVEAQRTSLQDHKYCVERLDSTKTSHHYCEFSGGGDLFVTKEVKLPLVFLVPSAFTDDELEFAI